MLELENQKDTLSNESLLILLQNQNVQTSLNEFLKTAYENVGRFLAYRKDYLMLELFIKGIITRKSWITNSQELTKKGEALLALYLKEINKQRVKVDQIIANPSSALQEITQLNSYLLFIPNLGDTLVKLQEVILNNDLIQHIDGNLKIFLNPNFDLKDFNRQFFTVYNYKFDWSQAIDLTRWIPI